MVLEVVGTCFDDWTVLLTIFLRLGLLWSWAKRGRQTGYREHKPGDRTVKMEEQDPDQTFSRGVWDAPASLRALFGTHM